MTANHSGRSLRTSIELELTQLLASPINPDRSNTGKTLWNLYFWQVVGELARKRVEAGWEGLQAAGGLVDEDDRLRTLAAGEHIAAESNKFSVLVKVSEPRRSFDKDKFIAEVARKFRVATEKIEAVAATCMEKGKPALTKRVIELE